jgi:hypothetical protein
VLYYSDFVIASSVTTFRFLTDLQLLYLDAVDNFLNHGSLDRGPAGQDVVDHGFRDPEPPNLEPRGLEPLDLEAIGLEPIGPEPLDHGSIDHRPAPLPVLVDQDNFAAAVMATTVIPVMSAPRLALIDGGKIVGGKSDSLDGRNREDEPEPTQSGRTDAPASDGPDEQDDREQNGQETARRENGWINKTAATVVAVAAGAALLEAALLPGLALGVATIAAPKYVSRLARAINPLFRSTVRATYKLAKKPGEAFAEAQHQINGIIAEARAEDANHAGMRAAEELRAAA